MILELFGFLCFIALVLIVIGLARPMESAQALVGFVFLFLLAMVLLNGAVEVEVGAQTNTTYDYDSSGYVNMTVQNIVYQQEAFDDSNSRRMGIYLAVAAIVGFSAVLIGLRRTRKNEFSQG